MLVALAVNGCFPSDSALVTVWVHNRQAEAVLLRHTDENGTVVLDVPAGYSGRAATFSSGTKGRVELLTRDCAIVDGPVALPSSGAVVVEVERDVVAVSPTSNPTTIDEPLLPESELCPTPTDSN